MHGYILPGGHWLIGKTLLSPLERAWNEVSPTPKIFKEKDHVQDLGGSGPR